MGGGGGGGGCLAESGARMAAALVGSASSPASLFGGAAGTQVLSESPESVRAAAWREYLDSTSTPVPAQISAMEVECKQVFKQLLNAIPAQQKAAGACEDDAVSALVSPEGLLPQIPVVL